MAVTQREAENASVRGERREDGHGRTERSRDERPREPAGRKHRGGPTGLLGVFRLLLGLLLRPVASPCTWVL